MSNLTHTFTVDATPQEVYDAIIDVVIEAHVHEHEVRRLGDRRLGRRNSVLNLLDDHDVFPCVQRGDDGER